MATPISALTTIPRSIILVLQMRKPTINVNLPKVLLSSTSLNGFGDNIQGSKHSCPREPFYLGKQKFHDFNETDINNPYIYPKLTWHKSYPSIRNYLFRKNPTCHHFIRATYARAVERKNCYRRPCFVKATGKDREDECYLEAGSI